MQLTKAIAKKTPEQLAAEKARRDEKKAQRAALEAAWTPEQRAADVADKLAKKTARAARAKPAPSTPSDAPSAANMSDRLEGRALAATLRGHIHQLGECQVYVDVLLADISVEREHLIAEATARLDTLEKVCVRLADAARDDALEQAFCAAYADAKQWRRRLQGVGALMMALELYPPEEMENLRPLVAKSMAEALGNKS